MTIKQAQLLASDSLGIYIPQAFAECIDLSQVKYVTQDQIDILLDGPDHEHYWDVWDEVLDNAETTDGGVFYQDGDLWLIYPDQAIEAVNDLCESMVEYETTHVDAGENYAHLVGESWDIQKTRDIIEQFHRELFDSSEYVQGSGWINYKPLWETLGIHPRWKDIDPDVLADIALESFTMESGSMYYPQGVIILDSFPVGEIEIDLSSLGIDGITMEHIRESCDAYISSDGYAYVSTDAVWYAVLDVPMFNAQIEQYINDKESE